MSEINLFNRWTVKKKYFWIGMALIPVLCVVTFFVTAGISRQNFGMAYDMVDLESPAAYGVAGGYNDSFGDYNEGYAVESMPMEEMSFEADGKAVYDVGDTTVSANNAVATSRLIIREGNISIYVEKTRQTRDDIEAMVYSFSEEGGYVINASESSRGENKEPYISMAIRVPVDQFSRMMDAIEDMGVEVINSNETAQDVTEEYVDLEGRVEALEASRDRLLELMANAAFTEDLLRAEQELTIREAELEALFGRMNYLSQSASLSRIYIDLQPYELYEPIDTSWKPAVTFRHAVEDLIDGMQNFADFLIYFGIAALPWLVFFGLIIWGVVAIVRRRKRKKLAKQEK